MSELVIMVGVQGSGKSTWCRTHLWHSHLRLSRDLLGTPNRQSVLFHSAIATGTRVVLDNTHPTVESRSRWIQIAKAAGYTVKAVFLEVDLSDAIERNAARAAAEQGPELAVRGTFAKLVAPTVREGFDEIYVVD